MGQGGGSAFAEARRVLLPGFRGIAVRGHWRAHLATALYQHCRTIARQTRQRMPTNSHIRANHSLPSHNAPVAERKPAWLRGEGMGNRKSRFRNFGRTSPTGRCAMIGGNKRG